ncbi:E3 ubiquitin-protein ligase RNF186 [Artibeus jamaicensis]|uniref:E3 ubiquitin-protein ligase RNF186 n=1 Tax=Artibeus jamaicensis TaxID=9417 RepID=UPI00235A6835|nr:E3 ubiquitin-protein ligase RNF186 [Artibeus jamaicensis]
MAHTEVPQQPQPFSAGATTTDTEGPAEGHDLECPVCREPYSCARPPKLLGCPHSFCAVCLKLLLRVQDNTWSIPCPVCRRVTAVPGGLICSLRDQEAVAGQLAWPCPEMQPCPWELVNPVALTAGHPSLAGEDEQDVESVNHTAARRLVAHLLLLALLIVLILPFIYPSVMQWMFTFIIALALLMSTLFCCHLGSRGGCWPSPRTLVGSQRKHSEISSIA